MKQGNESAFPTTNPETGINYGGLTKREWFAGLILSSVSISLAEREHGNEPYYAKRAVAFADALIAELERKEE